MRQNQIMDSGWSPCLPPSAPTRGLDVISHLGSGRNVSRKGVLGAVAKAMLSALTLLGFYPLTAFVPSPHLLEQCTRQNEGRSGNWEASVDTLPCENRKLHMGKIDFSMCWWQWAGEGRLPHLRRTD